MGCVWEFYKNKIISFSVFVSYTFMFVIFSTYYFSLGFPFSGVRPRRLLALGRGRGLLRTSSCSGTERPSLTPVDRDQESMSRKSLNEDTKRRESTSEHLTFIPSLFLYSRYKDNAD